MSSITLLSGENLYALRCEKRRWIEEFAKKHGPDNIVRLEGKGLTIRALLDEVGVMPFLADKRLVVVDTVPKSTKEEIEALVTSIHPSTILLFVDPAPDKRLGGVKKLLDEATVKPFPLLKGQKIVQWLEAEAHAFGLRFGTGASVALLEQLGEDQDALSSELQKLSTAVKDGLVMKEDIALHTIPTDEGVVWTMTDLVSAGKKKEALQYARKLLERGSDAYGLWAILLSMLKNVVAVKAAVDDRLANPRDIAERTGVHPFALRSVQPYATRCKREDLARTVRWAAEADTRLKTGGYRATDEAPEELHVLIERFLMELPSA